jgi:hypothetical protein
LGAEAVEEGEGERVTLALGVAVAVTAGLLPVVEGLGVGDSVPTAGEAVEAGT